MNAPPFQGEAAHAHRRRVQHGLRLIPLAAPRLHRPRPRPRHRSNGAVRSRHRHLYGRRQRGVQEAGPDATDFYRRGPRAKQVRHTFVFDSYSRLQEASTARPALAVTPRCTERRTENAGGENLLVKARHAAIRPARVCAVHTCCSATSGIRNNSSFWGASCYQASGSYPLKPD